MGRRVTPERIELPSKDEEVRISPRTGKPIDKKCAPKTKRKPRGKGANSPVIGDNGLNLADGDNKKYMSVNLALWNMPEIDLEDVTQVQTRLSEFFNLYTAADMKPTVAGMAMALGINRSTLAAIARDYPINGQGYKSALPKPVTESIKRAYQLMENLWETYMNSGKVNPVSGIFLGKNNYGYQDKTEYVLTPNKKDDADYSPEEIRQRYLPADSDTEA